MQALRSVVAPLRLANRHLAAAAAQAEAAAAEAPKPKRYKRKTLAEVAAFLPENGLGARFTRLLWIRNGYEQSYWTITRVKHNSEGVPRFYGRLTWRGVERTYNRRVNTQCKRGWRFIRDEVPSPPSTTTTTPASTSQAAAPQ